MPHVGTQRPNASLTSCGRRKMVQIVIDGGSSIDAAAERLRS